MNNSYNIANRNNCSICAMTGEDEPDVGSTAVAIASPDDDAIFSPANTAAEKKKMMKAGTMMKAGYHKEESEESYDVKADVDALVV